MSQWQELLSLGPDLLAPVIQMYEGRFRSDIRHSLCCLIEGQDWDSAASDENKARQCFYTLVLYVEEQWKQSIQDNNILQGPDFPGMRNYLLTHFQNEPLRLATILSECLKEEKKILKPTSQAQSCGSLTLEQSWRELDKKVKELKSRIAGVKKGMKELVDQNEKLDFIQENWQNQVEQHHRLAKSSAIVEEECLRRANDIAEKKQELLRQTENILYLAGPIVATLTEVELPEWKRRQQLACIGSPADTSLDHFRSWFRTVTEVLLQVREQMQRLQDQNQRNNNNNHTDTFNLSGPLADIENFAVSLLTKLLTNALVVEEQPVMTSSPQRPLILKTGVRFTVTVRFLADLPEFKCLLKVKPVFDKDVEEAKTVKGFRKFDFSKSGSKVLDEDTPSGGLVAEFGLLSLNEQKTKAKGSNESDEMHVHSSKRTRTHHSDANGSEPEIRLGVTEELHLITFVTVFKHAGLECNIEASTLPVVVISSTNQAVSAWASIMWYNMLSTREPRNLSLFVDPPPLTWTQLSQVLSWQFVTVGQRGLNEDQLYMLRERIVDNQDELVSLSTFKSGNVWIWIDGILDLIKKYLEDLWREGFIMGFVNRKRTRALLQEKQTGTFLIRFSESNKDGAITFSWVEHFNGEIQVHAVQPYTKNELKLMSLQDIIYHYSLRAQSNTRNPLLYLYPDIPKDEAFGRFYKKSAMLAPKKVVDGYVNRHLVPMSVCPTPPRSPAMEDSPMDVGMEIDVDTVNCDADLFWELFSDVFEVYQPMPPAESSVDHGGSSGQWAEYSPPLLQSPTQ